VNGLGSNRTVDGVVPGVSGGKQCAWSAKPPPIPNVNGAAWMVVDLGSSMRVTRVVIYGNGGYCAAGFTMCIICYNHVVCR
jgi:hypothetical protein